MTQASANVNIMIKAARKAARSLLRDFGEVENLQVSAKGPGDFVSRADIKAEQLIRDELTEARPNYGWLGEESAEVKGEDPTRRWIVDPLDGTTNFLHGLPHWAISIGLEHKGEIVAGVVYDPVKDEMFVAEKGAGRLAQRPAAARLRAAGHDRDDLRHRHPLRRRGRAARGAARDRGADAADRRHPPLGLGGARPRLCGGGAARRLLGARPQALGHGGRDPAGARGRRLRRHASRTAATSSRRTSRPTPTFRAAANAQRANADGRASRRRAAVRSGRPGARRVARAAVDPRRRRRSSSPAARSKRR